MAPVCRRESSGRLVRRVRAAQGASGSRSCGDAEDLDVYILGWPPTQPIADPSTDDKRAAAGIGDRPRDAARDIHRGVEIRHAQIILRAYTKRAGRRPALACFLCSMSMNGCFVLTRRGDRRRAAFARPAKIRIQQSAAAFCPSADPTRASRIRTRCTGATCARPRSGGVRHVRGDHRGIAEPYR